MIVRTETLTVKVLSEAKLIDVVTREPCSQKPFALVIVDEINARFGYSICSDKEEFDLRKAFNIAYGRMKKRDNAELLARLQHTISRVKKLEDVHLTTKAEAVRDCVHSTI